METSEIIRQMGDRTLSVTEFCREFGFVQTNPKVGSNSNGLPFVTFIDRANVAENIYFSKSQSEGRAGQPITGIGYFDGLAVSVHTNAAGEARLKLQKKGESKRINLVFA